MLTLKSGVPSGLHYIQEKADMIQNSHQNNLDV